MRKRDTLLMKKTTLTSWHRPRPIPEHARTANIPAKWWEPMRGQQCPRRTEHVGALLAFLPLRATILEPHLKKKIDFFPPHR